MVGGVVEVVVGFVVGGVCGGMSLCAFVESLVIGSSLFKGKDTGLVFVSTVDSG